MVPALLSRDLQVIGVVQLVLMMALKLSLATGLCGSRVVSAALVLSWLTRGSCAEGLGNLGCFCP